MHHKRRRRDQTRQEDVVETPKHSRMVSACTVAHSLKWGTMYNSHAFLAAPHPHHRVHQHPPAVDRSNASNTKETGVTMPSPSQSSSKPHRRARRQLPKEQNRQGTYRSNASRISSRCSSVKTGRLSAGRPAPSPPPFSKSCSVPAAVARPHPGRATKNTTPECHSRRRGGAKKRHKS